jgi:hypothetical protein
MRPGNYVLDLVVSKGAILSSERVIITVITRCFLKPTVYPIVEKIIDNGDGTFTAHFGYLNKNTENVIIPYGPENRFCPSPQFRGQPMLFKPGRTRRYPDSWFQVNFTRKKLVWILNGRIAVASRCSPYVIRRPFVRLKYPIDGGSYPSTKIICIRAEAYDKDGFITRVEFYVDDNLLEVDTKSPYSIKWQNPFPGEHRLYAVAYDDDHLTKKSETVHVVVY